MNVNELAADHQQASPEKYRAAVRRPCGASAGTVPVSSSEPVFPSAS